MIEGDFVAKRETVDVKVETISTLADENGWSEAAFSRKIGKHSRWLSEVRRGRNLPSPEEAAQMCAILQVRPEDILTQPEDVELVQSLIDGQKEKADPQKEIGLDDTTKRLLAIAADGTPEEIDKIIEYAAFLRSQRDKG